MPSSRAFSLVTDSERFKATEARNAEAPDAMSALNRSASLSDHTFFLATTSRSYACRARSRTLEMFCWFLGGSQADRCSVISLSALCATVLNPPRVVFPFLALSFNFCAM